MLVGYRGWKGWMGRSASDHDGIPFNYWLIGVFDVDGELLVMLLSLAIHLLHISCRSTIVTNLYQDCASLLDCL